MPVGIVHVEPTAMHQRAVGAAAECGEDAIDGIGVPGDVVGVGDGKGVGVLDVGLNQIPEVDIDIGRETLIQRGQGLVVVLDIHGQGQSDLAGIGKATCLACAFLRLGKHGEENGRQNGDNGDHHKQLDQGETGSSGRLRRRTRGSHWDSFRYQHAFSRIVSLAGE